MRLTTLIIYVLLLLGSAVLGLDLEGEARGKPNPVRDIKVIDWNFFVSWGGVAVIHHVTLENTSDFTYTDVLVKVKYYSRSAPSAGVMIGSTSGVLKITVPPRSKKTYLKSGATLGMGSSGFGFGGIEILNAVAVGE